MRAYTLLAPAKINLYLEIIGDRADGYHELVMVMQSIDLADRVEIRANGTESIRVACDHPEVPIDASNLAYRAAALMQQQFPTAFDRYGGVDITIQKQIPVGAGLAGGSGNAAAVLVGLDLLWKLGLTHPEVQDLGAKLGSDVPFCIVGGTALATGRGEDLASLAALDQIYVVLAKYQSLSVSTAWAYKAYRESFHTTYLCAPDNLAGRRQQVHSGAMMAAIAQRDISQIGQHLRNDFEKIVLPEYPAVAVLRVAMQTAGSTGAMMSGSGPTVFGLANSRTQAEQIASHVTRSVADPDLSVWVAQFTSKGIHLAE